MVSSNHLIGGLVLAFAVIVGTLVFLRGVSLFAILIPLAIAVLGVSIIAGGELVQLLMDIETNTRKP